MRRLLCCLLLPLAAVVAGEALAQAWPSKPVTLVVPFPPGGSSDQVARALGQRLNAALGQTFVIENKAGATGTIGAAAVKRAPADGYTFLVTSLGPLVIAPHLIKDIQYDPLKDLDPITIAVQAPNVLVVPASSPHKTMADVIAYQKANPGKMSFASSGNGSSDHLSAELFWQQTGTRGLHVPYKGGAPAISDLLGGQTDASFQNINAVISHIKSDKMRALAVTGDKRAALLPNVPTMAEAGVRAYSLTNWFGLLAPAGTPKDVVTKVHSDVVKVLSDPELRKKIAEMGADVVGNSPEEFGAWMRAESAQWAEIIKSANIRPE